jgi:hypothetical protein
MLQLSWGKLRREPATRWFDWSFAPMPNSDNRFARQNCFGPPSGFPLTSTWSGIVHHLSGHILHVHSMLQLIVRHKCQTMNTWYNTWEWRTVIEIIVVIPHISSYVFYAYRFYLNPLTHKQDRLLGPCFKTGPEGISIVSLPIVWLQSIEMV